MECVLCWPVILGTWLPLERVVDTPSSNTTLEKTGFAFPSRCPREELLGKDGWECVSTSPSQCWDLVSFEPV